MAFVKANIELLTGIGFFEKIRQVIPGIGINLQRAVFPGLQAVKLFLARIIFVDFLPTSKAELIGLV